MRILVTGGAGYIGSVLLPALLEAGHGVICYDRLVYGVAPILPLFRYENFQLVQADIRDAGELREALYDVDMVVHLAALVGYPACDADPAEAFRTNVAGTQTLNVLRGQIPVIFASTSSVYGKVEQMCDETVTPDPLSLYGRTKLEAEAILRRSGKVVILRFATAFGLSPRMRFDVMPNHFAHELVNTGSLELYEPTARRSFIHVTDIAQAIALTVDEFDAMAEGVVFNVGTEAGNCTKFELASLIGQTVSNCVISAVDGQDPEQRDYEVGYERIRQFGFFAQVSLQEGVTELTRAFQAERRYSEGLR